MAARLRFGRWGGGYTYDLADRVLTAANGVDTLTWTYQLGGRLLSEASAVNSSNVAYTYDVAGNRLTVSLDGELIAGYAYDDASRLTSITRNGRTFGFGYDALSRRTTLSSPNGVGTTYTYDELSRLLTLTAAHGPVVVADSSYSLDAVGNRLSKGSTGFLESYGYDALDRLVSAERSGRGGSVLAMVVRWSWQQAQRADDAGDDHVAVQREEPPPFGQWRWDLPAAGATR